MKTLFIFDQSIGPGKTGHKFTIGAVAEYESPVFDNISDLVEHLFGKPFNMLEFPKEATALPVFFWAPAHQVKLYGDKLSRPADDGRQELRDIVKGRGISAYDRSNWPIDGTDDLLNYFLIEIQGQPCLRFSPREESRAQTMTYLLTEAGIDYPRVPQGQAKEVGYWDHRPVPESAFTKAFGTPTVPLLEADSHKVLCMDTVYFAPGNHVRFSGYDRPHWQLFKELAPPGWTIHQPRRYGWALR
jgi:hypothetical protein